MPETQKATDLRPSPRRTNTLTKRMIIQRIWNADSSLPKERVLLIVGQFLDAIKDHLSNGGRVEFRHFGVFEVKHCKARLAGSPRMGPRVAIPARNRVKFSASQKIRLPPVAA